MKFMFIRKAKNLDENQREIRTSWNCINYHDYFIWNLLIRISNVTFEWKRALNLFLIDMWLNFKLNRKRSIRNNNEKCKFEIL